MRAGFVVERSHWQVVLSGLPDGLVAIEWATHTADEALEFLALGGIELLIIDAHPELLDERIVVTADERGVVVAALITGDQSVGLANQAGIGHQLRQPDDLRALVATLEGRPELPAAPVEIGAPQRTGIVRVFTGAHGAPGVTSLCVAQASVLAREGLRVAVIDADARGGTIALALGLTEEIPGFLAAVRLAGKSQLSDDQLDRLGVAYEVPPVTFTVYSGTPRPLVRAEAPRDHVDHLLERARELFDVIVVDTGSGGVAPHHPGESPTAHAELSEHLLWRADEVNVVCAASIPGVARCARVLPEIHTHSGVSPVRVWLNGVDTSRRATDDEATVREALWRYAQLSDYARLPLDYAAMRQAMRQAVTVADAQPSSPLVAAIRAESAGLIESHRPHSPERRGTPTSDKPAVARARGRWRQEQVLPGLLRALNRKWHQLTALR